MHVVLHSHDVIKKVFLPTASVCTTLQFRDPKFIAGSPILDSCPIIPLKLMDGQAMHATDDRPPMLSY